MASWPAALVRQLSRHSSMSALASTSFELSMSWCAWA